MLIYEYHKYCYDNDLYINVNELKKDTTYYWHPNFIQSVYIIKLEKIIGTTYIFKSNNNKMAFSSIDNFIVGISEIIKDNTFEFEKYIE